MDIFQLTVQQCEATMSTEKSGLQTIEKEFDCWQEADNREDRYAVAIYEDTQSSTVLRHLKCENFCISAMFFEHNRTIMGRVTTWRHYCHWRET